mmetsp:Transcript_87823/g.250141  ORF Transcript_87823/g.250141 Transcript_87823/m.250141 type:complete len:1052 (+) Transcript_87823:549-3704(+)
MDHRPSRPLPWTRTASPRPTSLHSLASLPHSHHKVTETVPMNHDLIVHVADVVANSANGSACTIAATIDGKPVGDGGAMLKGTHVCEKRQRSSVSVMYTIVDETGNTKVLERHIYFTAAPHTLEEKQALQQKRVEELQAKVAPEDIKANLEPEYVPPLRSSAAEFVAFFSTDAANYLEAPPLVEEASSPFPVMKLESDLAGKLPGLPQSPESWQRRSIVNHTLDGLYWGLLYEEMEAEIKEEARLRMAQIHSQLDLKSSMTGMMGNVGKHVKRIGSVSHVIGIGNLRKELESEKEEPTGEADVEVRSPAPPSSMDLVKAEQGDAPKEAMLGEEEEEEELAAIEAEIAHAKSHKPRRDSTELTEEELMTRRVEELHKEQSILRSVKANMEKQLPHHPHAEGDEEELLWQWDEFDPNMNYKVFVVPHFIKRCISSVEEEEKKCCAKPHTTKSGKVITEQDLVDNFGAEVTLYYKYLKFLERLSAYLCIPGLLMCINFMVGGQLSLAGATTVIFDAGLVMFGMGNVALVEGTGLTEVMDANGTMSWSAVNGTAAENKDIFTKHFRLYVVGYLDAVICLVIMMLAVRLHWLQNMSLAKYQEDSVEVSSFEIQLDQLDHDVTAEQVADFVKDYGAVAEDGIVMHYRCRDVLNQMFAMGIKLEHYDSVKLMIESLEDALKYAMAEVEHTVATTQQALNSATSMATGGLQGAVTGLGAAGSTLANSASDPSSMRRGSTVGGGFATAIKSGSNMKSDMADGTQALAKNMSFDAMHKGGMQGLQSGVGATSKGVQQGLKHTRMLMRHVSSIGVESGKVMYLKLTLAGLKLDMERIKKAISAQDRDMKARFGRPGHGDGVDTISAFVTFDTTVGVNAMLKRHVNKSDKAKTLAKEGHLIDIHKAPPPRDLKFENLEVPKSDRRKRRVFFAIMTTILICLSLSVILYLKFVFKLKKNEMLTFQQYYEAFVHSGGSFKQMNEAGYCNTAFTENDIIHEANEVCTEEDQKVLCWFMGPGALSEKKMRQVQRPCPGGVYRERRRHCRRDHREPFRRDLFRGLLQA